MYKHCYNKENSKEKFMKKRLYFRIFTILITVFIFSNSLRPAAVSSEDSGTIVEFLNWFFGLFGRTVDYDVLQNIVRKTAHFAEYALQGMLLVGCFSGELKERIIYVMFFGLFTACTDEFLQLFAEGRAGQIQDVFIDFAGNLAGLASAGGIGYIRRMR